MKAAAKSIIITPKIGIPIGGNVREDNKSRGVHDDLMCNIILLENGEDRICFAGFDILQINKSQCDEIKKVISSELAVCKENVIVNATHTHSGPDITDIFKGKILDEAVSYFNELKIKLKNGIKGMEGSMSEITLKAGKSQVNDLSFNRRLVLKDNSLKMNFEQFNVKDVVRTTGPIDPELLTMSLWTSDNRLLAVLVNFTLHPAVLVGHKWLFSRDYINYLDKYIKEVYQENTVVYFANGAEGNINHINYKDNNQDRGFSEAKRIGARLGEYTVENIKNSQIQNNNNISCITKEIELPLRKISKKDLEWAKMVIERDKNKKQDLLDGVPDLTYAMEYLKVDKRYEPYLKTIIQAARVGENIFTTLPGEVFVEFGLKIKENSKSGITFVIGLANDAVGYVPDNKAFKEGGYEIKTASSSQLAENAGEILCSEVIDLIRLL